MMSKPKLWLSTPCYGGLVLQEFANSVGELYKMCAKLDIKIVLDTMENESLIPRARCVAVGRFLSNEMAKDFTHFMFIDADVEFKPESVLRLLLSGHDVSVACYPKKVVNFEGAKKEIVENGNRPPEMASADLVVNVGSSSRGIVNGFVEILDGPTGFMMIKREVLEKMRDHYPELMCVNDHANRDFDSFPALFDCMIDPVSKRYLSEDYAFCRRWQNMGGKIYGDTQTTLGHVGNLSFGGNMGTRLRSKDPNQEPIQIKKYFEPKQTGGWGFLISAANHQLYTRTMNNVITVVAQLTRQNVPVELNFTDMDPANKADNLSECIRRYDTVIFLDFGSCFDMTSLGNVNWQSMCCVLVIPSLRPVLNWERFKKMCQTDEEELLQHKAVVYDTEVEISSKKKSTNGKEIDFYDVKNSDSKILFIDSQQLKNNKNVIQVTANQQEWIKYFKKKNLRVRAIVDINTTNTIAHKCVSVLGKSSSTRIVSNVNAHPQPSQV